MHHAELQHVLRHIKPWENEPVTTGKTSEIADEVRLLFLLPLVSLLSAFCHEMGRDG